MAVSGEFEFSTSNQYIKGKVVYRQVQGNSSDNTSTVNVWVYLTRTNTGYKSYGIISTDVSITTDNSSLGAPTYSQSESNFPIPSSDAIVNGSWKLVFAKPFSAIPHNNDGSLSITISVSANSNFNLNFSTVKSAIQLTQIPRYATINTWKITSIAPQSITFSWATDSNISNIICYFDDIQKYSSSLNSNSGSFSVSGLSEGTTYNKITIKVTRKDSGLTTTSEDVSGTTTYYLPTSNLSFVSNSINSLHLKWESNYECDAIWLYNGTNIIYSASSLNTVSGDIILTPDNWSSISPGTNYLLSIKVRRKISQGVQTSSILSVSTLDLPSISSTTSKEFNIGDSISVIMDNSNNNSYTLSFQVYRINNDESYEWFTIWSENELIGTGNVELSLSANTLYDACVNTNALSCRISCVVSNNSITYPVSYYYLTANVVNSNPIFNGFSWKTNVGTTINSIIGGTQNMITGYGNLILVFDDNCVTPINSATIKYLEAKIIYNNIVITSGNIDYSQYAFDFNVNVKNITNEGTYTIRILAVDSRGNKSDFIEHSFVVYPYHIPALSISLQRQNNFEAKTYINLIGSMSLLKISGVQKNNITSLKYRYVESGNSFVDPNTNKEVEFIDITDYVVSTNDNDIIVNLSKASDTVYFVTADITKSYIFQFILTDELYSSYVFEVFLPQGKPSFSIFDTGHTTVDKIPNFDSPAKLQVGSDIMVTDNDGNDVLVLEKLLSHTHDDRYYTEGEIDNLLSRKSDESHIHDDRYYTENEINNLLSDKSDKSHTHDDRYYTENEIDEKIENKFAPITSVGNITRMRGGTQVVTFSNNGTGSKLFTDSQVNSWFGVTNSNATNTAVFASNGDGTACSAHVDGATHRGSEWYAVLGSSFTGSARINYMIVYWG